MKIDSGTNFGTSEELFKYELCQWIGIVNEAAEDWGYKDVPWWYKERAQLSLFAGAIWRTGGSAFEEFAMTKQHEGAPYSGRCDFYCRTADSQTFLAEAKHTEILTTDGNADQEIRTALASAELACKRCTPQGERVIAIIFLTLVIPKSEGAASVGKIIERFCEAVAKVEPTSAAWVFPERARAYPTGDDSKSYQPGGAILIKALTPKRLVQSATIPELLQKLAAFPSSESVTNQYENSTQRENLRNYLEALRKAPSCECLLVGESPGHRGCAVTGIPFTSEEVLRTATSPFINELRPKVKIAGFLSENTATETWKSIEKLQHPPAFWNIFPFHAHKKGERKSNRKPTRAETEAGLEFVDLIKDILHPKEMFAVGRVAHEALSRKYQNIEYVRHPARQGAALFRKGLAPLLGI